VELNYSLSKSILIEPNAGTCRVTMCGDFSVPVSYLQKNLALTFSRSIFVNFSLVLCPKRAILTFFLQFVL